ncbi:MAG: Eco57I restriction-modification methylase domain-containing protein, partial [Flavobacteriales bacterium]|nr:Eco57I restriction-modification methylase domain-containing protein [Flavobacteriales bacterium]
MRQPEKPLVYFDWQLDFPEVLNPNVAKDPGFDIVIANPPYMRVQVKKAMPEFKAALERKYTNAKGAWDLANVFFERAVQLVKDSGNC